MPSTVKKPLKVVNGQKEQFASTDTIAASNLASGGNDGDIIVKDSTNDDEKKWVSPNNPLMSQIFS